MKAIIEFNRNDPDDFKALKRAMQADEAFAVLWKIRHVIIPKVWADINDDRIQSELEKLVDEINSTIEDHGIDVELAD